MYGDSLRKFVVIRVSLPWIRPFLASQFSIICCCLFFHFVISEPKIVLCTHSDANKQIWLFAVFFVSKITHTLLNCSFISHELAFQRPVTTAISISSNHPHSLIRNQMQLISWYFSLSCCSFVLFFGLSFPPTFAHFLFHFSSIESRYTKRVSDVVTIIQYTSMIKNNTKKFAYRRFPIYWESISSSNENDDDAKWFRKNHAYLAWWVEILISHVSQAEQ